MDKEVRQLSKKLAKQGLEVRISKKHVAVSRNGIRVVTLPQSPSDFRWRKNARAALRKHKVSI